MKGPTIFKAFEKLKVLVVGDVMIDRYLTGAVNRVSPEAPVPVVQLNQRENRLGGAANVALNIRALGATPILCSVIGKDDDAELFFDLLPKNDLSAKGIVQSEKRPTTVKTRIIAQNQHLLRVDNEITDDLNQKDEKELVNRIIEFLDQKSIDLILFQDYNKGVLSLNVIRTIVLEAIKRDIPTAVDPKYNNFWAYKHVTLFKPNLKEIKSQLDFPVHPDIASLDKAAASIKNKLGNQYTMITLSEKGLYLEEDGKSKIYPTQPRIIADVCGAGDTVISLASLGLAIPAKMEEIAVLANLAGGQVCEKVGVVPVDRLQLENEFLQLEKDIKLV